MKNHKGGFSGNVEFRCTSIGIARRGGTPGAGGDYPA